MRMVWEAMAAVQTPFGVFVCPGDTPVWGVCFSRCSPGSGCFSQCSPWFRVFLLTREFAAAM